MEVVRRKVPKIVLIRHSEDEKPSESTMRFDPKLNSKGVDLVGKMYRRLIKKCVPREIYYSPMRRSKQTAKLFEKLLKRDGHRVTMIESVGLSRYFPDRERRREPVVESPNVDVTEGHEEFKKRVRDFAATFDRLEGDVWMITHYLVVREYSKRYNFDIPDSMPPLWNIMIAKRR